MNKIHVSEYQAPEHYPGSTFAGDNPPSASLAQSFKDQQRWTWFQTSGRSLTVCYLGMWSQVPRCF